MLRPKSSRSQSSHSAGSQRNGKNPRPSLSASKTGRPLSRTGGDSSSSRSSSRSSSHTRPSSSLRPTSNTKDTLDPRDKHDETRAASIAASAGGPETRRPKFTIWPEWNDTDVNGEKWEGAKKDDRKGKSPTAAQHLFDDPEGKIEMPSSLKVDHWKRPHEFISDKMITVVDQDQMMNGFDLITPNEHLHESELMRFMISQITALWEMGGLKSPDPSGQSLGEEDTHSWKPWEHIYSNCKAGKGPHVPLFNPHGKYVVRLYWMGCWRKIYVDDSLPFDSEERLLLPATTTQEELWPMLLAKALIKVASLDYTGGNNSSEFGDFSVIHCLTGWLPETIPLQGYGHCHSLHVTGSGPCPSPHSPSPDQMPPVVTTSQVLDKYFELSMSNTDFSKKSRLRPSSSSRTKDVRYSHTTEIWELLKYAVPEWKLPEQEWEKEATLETMKKEASTPSEPQKDEKSEKDAVVKESKQDLKEKSVESRSGKEKSPKEVKENKGKDGKEDKKDKKEKGDKEKGDKDKEKHKERSEDYLLPEKPEVVVFASYARTPKYPVKVSVLGEMADASERLRQIGLSHLYPHLVWVTQTRSCPLEPPPPPEKIPAWKLIRPHKKKATPSDEPKAEPEPPKPIQCLEITSPFVNYKVSPVPIPTDIHRPKSSLERGGTRSRPSTGNRVGSIEETDETAQPELEIKAEEKKNEELLESHVTEDPSKTESDDSKILKAPSPKKRNSAVKKDIKETLRDQSPKPHERRASNKPTSASATKSDRAKSASQSESKQSRGEEESAKKKEKLSVDSKHQGSPSSAKGVNQEIPPAAEPADDSLVLEAGEEQLAEAELAEIQSEDNTPKPKKLWVDFDQFSTCFKTLYIFHKPNTYPCNQKYSDLKNVAQPGAPVTSGKSDKKPALGIAGVNPSSSKTSQTPTHTQNAPSPTNAQGVPLTEERLQHYLFVDSLEPSEITVSFSALPRWFDPPSPPMEEKKSHTSVKGGKDKDMEKEPTTLTSSSVLDGSISPEKPSTPVSVTPGTLVAEPYSWKSLVTGQPILRLRSTATRAAVLSLPPGRHVLRFMMNGPLGCHVNLCSATQFVFGDEETVMPQLTNESCRFRENAVQVISNLGKCINNLGDTEMFHQAWEDLVKSHCPYLTDKLMSKTHHFQIFNAALYAMLKRSLKDIISPDQAFAWRALVFDATSSNIMGLSVGSRPATGQTSHRGSAKPGSKGKQAPPEGEPDKVENTWANREPTPEEHVAAVKIQKVQRGIWVRKLKMARTPGTDENLKVLEQLQKAWPILEPNAEENGLVLFREMFKRDPEIMPKYPFYKDEWNKISYADYRGVYPDQPPNTWFIVFREVFYVKEEMLAVPKLYVPVHTCLLRVINNDTGEEIPKVFQKVAPYVYKKNRKGYTFVAEARTVEQGIMSGNWRMRLIGSLSPLPSPRNQEVNCSFTAKEIRDYYLPNAKKNIFRYTVKVTEDHLTSLQVCTSKTDVYIKLTVLDHEEEVVSATGKGHIVIPAFIFLKDYNPDEESKRSSSRSSNRGGKVGASAQNVSTKGGKRQESAKSIDGRTSRSSQQSDACSDMEPEERDTKPHKYIVQATVLKNSWPLSEREWGFVQTLKEQEKNELKVSYKERPPSPSPAKEKAPAAAAQKGKQGKGGKADKGGKEKDTKGSRPPSQQFDLSKPNWTFRVISDAQAAEDIETKKDTERADEIRAMKKAWEDAEPGRAAKALQSRLKYLSTHMIRVQPEGEEGKEETAEEGQAEEVPQTPVSFLDQPEGELSLEPPRPPTPKEILQPIDVTPFIRKTLDTPRFVDEEEIQKRVEAKQQEIAEFKKFREQVEKWREEDRQFRNRIKIRQLDQAEELQAALDAARDAVNTPREAFRQKYLEAERLKQEELAAQEAAMRAEQDAKSPKGRRSAKGKKSPPGKKKK